MAHRESWARSPVVLAQLLQLGVAWSFRQEPTTWVAVALAVVAWAAMWLASSEQWPVLLGGVGGSLVLGLVAAVRRSRLLAAISAAGTSCPFWRSLCTVLMSAVFSPEKL